MAENEAPAAAPASAPDAEPTALQELVEAVASEPPFTWDPMAQAAISVVGDLVGGTGGTPAVGPASTPLDQPTTPEQRDQMFASDPPVESDPLGQALVSAVGDVVLGPIVEGAEFLEKPLEHAVAFVASELGLYFGEKAADGARDGESADQGTSASEEQAKIDALDAKETEAYQQLNYWKQNVDEFERWMQWYYDQIRQENDYIKVLNEGIARARELQAKTGDPDKIFERSIEVDQALIKSAEQGIQMDRDMINALEIQLQAAREDLQKADDEILALEEKRQRLIDDLNEAVRQAAIASDQAPKP